MDDYSDEYDAHLTGPRRNHELDPDYLEHSGRPTEGRRAWDLSEWLDENREGPAVEAGPNPLGHYIGVKHRDGRSHSTFVTYTREEYEEVFGN